MSETSSVVITLSSYSVRAFKIGAYYPKLSGYFSVMLF